MRRARRAARTARGSGSAGSSGATTSPARAAPSNATTNSAVLAPIRPIGVTAAQPGGAEPRGHVVGQRGEGPVREVHPVAGDDQGPGVRAFTHLPVQEIGESRDLRRPVPVRRRAPDAAAGTAMTAPPHARSDEASTARRGRPPLRRSGPLRACGGTRCTSNTYWRTADSSCLSRELRGLGPAVDRRCLSAGRRWVLDADERAADGGRSSRTGRTCPRRTSDHDRPLDTGDRGERRRADRAHRRVPPGRRRAEDERRRHHLRGRRHPDHRPGPPRAGAGHPLHRLPAREQRGTRGGGGRLPHARSPASA